MSYLQVMTFFHTLISILAMLIGIPTIIGLWLPRTSRWLSRSFLFLAAGTSLTGFLFPFSGITPGIITGVVALIVLAIVLFAEFSLHLRGSGRWLYAIGIVVSEYLLIFVALVQAFQKIPLLHHLALMKAPFIASQIITLGLFIIIAVSAGLRFRPWIDTSDMRESSIKSIAHIRQQSQ